MFSVGNSNCRRLPMKSFKYIPVLFVFAPFLLSSCTSMLLVKSSWNEHQTVIDGKDNDWEDAMFYIPDAQLTAGIRNDSSDMYLILKATNRQQAFQIMGLGLTIWFDPSGGSSEKFGIHFPLGGREGGGFMRRDQDSDSMESPGRYSSFADMMPNELEILGANENGPVRLTIADAKGIELQINHGTDGLIYELKVPLHKSPEHPYAINAEGSAVGIGFEGGKFEPREGGGREGRGTRGGGEGGGMYPGGGEGGGEGMPGGEGGEGRGEGRGRGYRGSGQLQQIKQIDFWLKARIASPASSSN